MKYGHKTLIITRGGTVSRRDDLSSLLKTSVGRTRLAQSMVTPLRTTLDYQGFARRTLVIQQLPAGAQSLYTETPKYRHDTIVIRSRGRIGNKNGARVTVPQFEIVSNPTIRISDIKTRRFNLIDRYQKDAIVIRPNGYIGRRSKYNGNTVRMAVQKARDEIMAQEDAAVFAALDAASQCCVPEESALSDLSESSVQDAMKALDEFHYSLSNKNK